MQKRIEKKLKEFLDTNQVSRGIVLLMDPTNGAVLSWASQPSFNPNYYWQKEEEQRKSLFEENLDPNLVRRLRVRIAAIRKNGDSGDFLLPETIAMDDYGLEANEIEQLGRVMRPNKNVECLLPSCGSPPASLGSMSEQARNDAINPVEWAKTVSSMIK